MSQGILVTQGAVTDHVLQVFIVGYDELARC